MIGTYQNAHTVYDSEFKLGLGTALCSCVSTVDFLRGAPSMKKQLRQAITAKAAETIKMYRKPRVNAAIANVFSFSGISGAIVGSFESSPV